MHLIFFDLDGTLLNDASTISPFTEQTLQLLKLNNIAYTVATGRTMLSAHSILKGHNFSLPHIYNNGVTLWDPNLKKLSLENILSPMETNIVVDVALEHGVTPFVNTIDGVPNPQNNSSAHTHSIYHSDTKHQVEKDLVEKYFSRTHAAMLPIAALPVNSQVTNISMIGVADTINHMYQILNNVEHLVAYSGPALEGEQYRWMDVHHCLANKGSAVMHVKQKLGASNIICFGDSDNDLSMFASADECYAPANAKEQIKEKASAVIGHNNQDGIAHFLRERFSL